MKIDLAKLATEMRDAAVDHIDTEQPERDARLALVPAFAKLGPAFREAGVEQVSLYDLSDLMHAVGNLDAR